MSNPFFSVLRGLMGDSAVKQSIDSPLGQMFQGNIGTFFDGQPGNFLMPGQDTGQPQIKKPIIPPPESIGGGNQPTRPLPEQPQFDLDISPAPRPNLMPGAVPPPQGGGIPQELLAILLGLGGGTLQ